MLMRTQLILNILYKDIIWASGTHLSFFSSLCPQMQPLLCLHLKRVYKSWLIKKKKNNHKQKKTLYFPRQKSHAQEPSPWTALGSPLSSAARAASHQPSEVLQHSLEFWATSFGEYLQTASSMAPYHTDKLTHADQITVLKAAAHHPWSTEGMQWERNQNSSPSGVPSPALLVMLSYKQEQRPTEGL